MVNAYSRAQSAYQNSAAPIRTDRAAEYEAFARITRQLQKVLDTGNAPFSETAHAIHDNRRLWTILASDVSSEKNQLPAPLRAQLFYLAQFSHHHGREVLKGAADIQPLIDINMAVMRGLRQKGETE